MLVGLKKSFSPSIHYFWIFLVRSFEAMTTLSDDNIFNHFRMAARNAMDAGKLIGSLLLTKRGDEANKKKNYLFIAVSVSVFVVDWWCSGAG